MRIPELELHHGSFNRDLLADVVLRVLRVVRVRRHARQQSHGRDEKHPVTCHAPSSTEPGHWQRTEDSTGRFRECQDADYRAEQGSGLNAAPSASFLKCELWTYGCCKFSESATSVTTVSQTSPFGAVNRW